MLINNFFYKIKVFFGSIILKLFYITNNRDVRYRVHYQNILKKNQSVIFSVWHGQLLSIVYDLRNHPVHAVAGTHKDAEFISQIATNWGWTMIRGSSKEKGNVAYKKMLKILKQKRALLFITPDGPTGPARIPKAGIIRAAKATNSAIIPISAHSTSRWGFTNWDTFYLEKPFGKIYIEYGKPLFFDRIADQDKCIEDLIKAMNKVEKNNLYYAKKNKL